MPRIVFITVGEASGDQHAASLIRQLRQLDPNLVFQGIGGDAMRAAGAEIFADTVHRASYGWKSIFRIWEIKKLLKWTADHFRQSPPALQICIDSWSMNWNFAKLARSFNIPVLYYIAPQVWASRPGRIKRLRLFTNRIASIHQFEEKYLRDRGVQATYVGNPLFDTPVPPAKMDQPRFPNHPPVIGILPGSRRGVAKDNFPHLLDVAQRILDVYPDARFLIPTVSATDSVVRAGLAAHASRLQLSQHDDPADPQLHIAGPFTFAMNSFDRFVSQCDLCITVSGTAALQIAGHGVPMIVVYRLSPFVWFVARWLITTRTYSLVNILSESPTHIVPEFIPWYGSNLPVAQKALEFLKTPDLLAQQRQTLLKLFQSLNQPGATRNTANLAMELLK